MKYWDIIPPKKKFNLRKALDQIAKSDKENRLKLPYTLQPGDIIRPDVMS